MVLKEYKMDNLFNIVDSMFNEYWSTQGLTPVSTKAFRATTIPVNMIKEEDESLTVEIAIPGKTKDDVTLKKEVIDGVDYVVFDLKEVEQTEEQKAAEEKRKYIDRKIKVTKHCAIKVPSNLDVNKLTAKVENGLMTIKIPVAEEAKPVEFTIE